MSVAASNRRISVALSDPLTAVLLWGLALSGKLDQEVLALLGLKNVDLELIEQRFATQLTELRVLARTSMLFDPQRLGQLAMARISTLLLMASIGTLDGEKALTQATRALARLPLWLRDPDLDSLEREARRETALARIEEVNARRAEAQARRLEAATRARATGRESARDSAGQDSVPVSAGRHSVAAAVERESTSASVGRHSVAADDPNSSTLTTTVTPTALEAEAKTAFPGVESTTLVKSDPADDVKPAFSGAIPAPQVKPQPAETSSAWQPEQPGTERRPVSQGRRKLPKAVRKAAGMRR